MDPDRSAAADLIADGLVDRPNKMRPRRVVLTLRGRLLADTVVRRLLVLVVAGFVLLVAEPR